MTHHDTDTQSDASSEQSSVTTQQKRKPETIEPEREPEVVGFHSAADADSCENYVGEYVKDIERCGNEATHTCVVYDGDRLVEIVMCDECGQPENAADDRRWSA